MCAALGCINGGLCLLSTAAQAYCDCPDRYTGLQCEIGKLSMFSKSPKLIDTSKCHKWNQTLIFLIRLFLEIDLLSIYH